MAIGRSHAQMGAWTSTLIAAFMAAGIVPKGDPRAVLLAFGLVIGAAVWNDLDHGSSGVRNSFGIVTICLSLLFMAASKGAYAATRTDRDARSRKAHRTLTHSGLGCVLIGGAFAGVCMISTPWGPVPAALAVGLVWGIGVNALRGAKIGDQRRRSEGRSSRPKRQRRRRGRRGEVEKLLRKLWRRKTFKWCVAITAGALAYSTPGIDGGWWPWYLGGSITLGMMVHCAGDAMTDVGIPWAWPLLNEHGKRWGHKWVLHRRLRFTTDHAGELVAMWTISFACTALLVLALFGPELAAALHITGPGAPAPG